jgi:large conductance mechanosensitive channel
MSLAREFKQFLLRGNVVDMAVAIIIGIAFGAVVKALVDYLITPLIAALFGKPDFSQLYFTINHSHFMYGSFINAVLAFIIVAFVVFLFVVKPVNALIARSKKEDPADPNLRKCPECLSEIPIAATRCRFCAVQVTPVPAEAQKSK